MVDDVDWSFSARVWNVDGAVARQIAILWAFFMYIGQATKDILAIPRPQSPPVLKLEKRYYRCPITLGCLLHPISLCRIRFRYIEEYGFPSTHAMFAAGIPLSLVLLSLRRYDVRRDDRNKRTIDLFSSICGSDWLVPRSCASGCASVAFTSACTRFL